MRSIDLKVSKKTSNSIIHSSTVFYLILELIPESCWKWDTIRQLSEIGTPKKDITPRAKGCIMKSMLTCQNLGFWEFNFETNIAWTWLETQGLNITHKSMEGGVSVFSSLWVGIYIATCTMIITVDTNYIVDKDFNASYVLFLFGIHFPIIPL